MLSTNPVRHFWFCQLFQETARNLFIQAVHIKQKFINSYPINAVIIVESSHIIAWDNDLAKTVAYVGQRTLFLLHLGLVRQHVCRLYVYALRTAINDSLNSICYSLFLWQSTFFSYKDTAFSLTYNISEQIFLKSFPNFSKKQKCEDADITPLFHQPDIT